MKQALNNTFHKANSDDKTALMRRSVKSIKIVAPRQIALTPGNLTSVQTGT